MNDASCMVCGERPPQGSTFVLSQDGLASTHRLPHRCTPRLDRFSCPAIADMSNRPEAELTPATVRHRGALPASCTHTAITLAGVLGFENIFTVGNAPKHVGSRRPQCGHFISGR